MQEDKYRTLPLRLAAGIIDIWPVLPFLVAAFVWPELPTASFAGLLLSLGAYSVGTGYFIVLHARSGQTVGKKICGVRVVTAAGEGPIGWRQSFLREAPLLVFLAVFILGDLCFFAVGEERTPTAVITIYLLAERLQRTWNFGDALCTLFNSKRRSLHDFIGGTVVIKTG